MMCRVSTLSAAHSIEIRLSQNTRQIFVQQGFDVIVSGSQGGGLESSCLKISRNFLIA
jgi:hypothetical protein